MTPVRRLIAASLLAAAPGLALAQTAPLKPDGEFRYALGAGGSYVSGNDGQCRAANFGAEGAFATTDSAGASAARRSGRAAAAETISESVGLMLMAESQHAGAAPVVPPEALAVPGAALRRAASAACSTPAWRSR